MDDLTPRQIADIWNGLEASAPDTGYEIDYMVYMFHGIEKFLRASQQPQQVPDAWKWRYVGEERWFYCPVIETEEEFRSMGSDPMEVVALYAAPAAPKG